MAAIDNFSIFRSRLEFKDKTDRYIVHVLRRPKDCKPGENYLGSNEHQRLIRTYYVDNIDYFNKKEMAIKDLCHANNARAYILPQVRNNYECLLNLGEKVLETIRLGNYSAKPEHLLRSAYCEYHKSRSKRWILDLDDDCMIEHLHKVNYGGQTLTTRKWTVDEVLKLVQESLAGCGKSPDAAYVVPTKSGHHIITEPFDLQKAFKKCSMLYEGVQKKVVEVKFTGPYESEDVVKDVVGWLHKDGMSLLYYNDRKDEERT